MSEEHPSADMIELERLRARLLDYESKMTEACLLVARVRHEINNPLAALLGQAQLLLREELGDKARVRVEAIEKQAMRINEIVSELRNVQTPEAGLKRAGGKPFR